MADQSGVTGISAQPGKRPGGQLGFMKERKWQAVTGGVVVIVIALIIGLVMGLSGNGQRVALRQKKTHTPTTATTPSPVTSPAKLPAGTPVSSAQVSAFISKIKSAAGLSYQATYVMSGSATGSTTGSTNGSTKGTKSTKSTSQILVVAQQGKESFFKMTSAGSGGIATGTEMEAIDTSSGNYNCVIPAKGSTATGSTGSSSPISGPFCTKAASSSSAISYFSQLGQSFTNTLSQLNSHTTSGAGKPVGATGKVAMVETHKQLFGMTLTCVDATPTGSSVPSSIKGEVIAVCITPQGVLASFSGHGASMTMTGFTTNVPASDFQLPSGAHVYNQTLPVSPPSNGAPSSNIG